MNAYQTKFKRVLKFLSLNIFIQKEVSILFLLLYIISKKFTIFAHRLFQSHSCF